MPTIPLSQDPLDPPRSQNGKDGQFMPYVPEWERLPDAVKRLMAGGRSEEQAQTDLCRAIADRAIKIQARLKIHTLRGITASNTVLDGSCFQIPLKLTPAHLDWKSSRPLKPWMVPRGKFLRPGYWELSWIEVSRADVTNVLCGAGKQFPRLTSSASSTGRLALTDPEMPITSHPTAGLDAAAPRRRGPRPLKFEQVKAAMLGAIQQGRLTLAELEAIREKNLEERYGVSRDTARKARRAVVSELNSRQSPTNDK